MGWITVRFTIKNRTNKNTYLVSVMVKVKLRRSAGSGKFVFIVNGRSSSVKSAAPPHESTIYFTSHHNGGEIFTFLYSNLSSTRFCFFCSRILVLLHTPYLTRQNGIRLKQCITCMLLNYFDHCGAWRGMGGKGAWCERRVNRRSHRTRAPVVRPLGAFRNVVLCLLFF